MEKEVQLSDLIKFLIVELKDIKEPWVLSGSAAYILATKAAGRPKDVDILTTKKGAKDIYGWIKGYSKSGEPRQKETLPKTEPGSKPIKFRGLYCKYSLLGFDLEVIGDLDMWAGDRWIKYFDLKSAPSYIDVAGVKCPIVPFDKELNNYLITGRSQDYIARLEALLEKGRQPDESDLNVDETDDEEDDEEAF
jgi:hypothetical protein